MRSALTGCEAGWTHTRWACTKGPSSIISWHALGILLVAVLTSTQRITAAGENRVAWLLLIGILIFSGTLYALAITGMRILGAITPIGGLAFIAGWLLLAYEAVRAKA